MMILMVAITMIFVNTTETVALQEARMTVYTNARYALDIMENDLLGAFGLNEPMKPGPGGNASGGGTYIPTEHIPQAFWMDNGVLPSAGAVPETGPGEMPRLNGAADPKAHYERAGDAIGFRTVTTVGNKTMTCEVTYILIPGDHALDSPQPNQASTINKPTGDLPPTLLQRGDTTRVRTVRTNRPVYTLMRRVRMANPTQVSGLPVFDLIPVVTDPAGNTVVVQDQELCYYVVGFNIEYLSSNRTFSQLAPSPCPHDEPLGNGVGANDTYPTAYRIPAVRITMRVVEDVSERQERTIQKVMWIPQQ
jgi:hypothetical protein